MNSLHGGVPFLKGPNAVAVGMFDGMHRGHVELIKTLQEQARLVGGRAVVLTFDRHPLEIVAPDKAPLYITTLERKTELLREAGAEEVVVLNFNTHVASLSVDTFADKYLAHSLGAASVVVGPNFRFGAGRAGNVETLANLGEKLGFKVAIAHSVEFNGAMISSTRIRSLIIKGRVKNAEEMLGRPFELPGQIVSGQKIGRTLGFPTANLLPPERHIIPRNGIYAAYALVNGRKLCAAVNIGVRPTIATGEVLIEAHLLDFNENIYGRKIVLYFSDRLRDEIKFESREALMEQISEDIEKVRSTFSQR